MISLTDVLFPVLLQCVAGEAGEDQPHDEATPSHFDLQGNAWINYNVFENIQKPRYSFPTHAIVSLFTR